MILHNNDQKDIMTNARNSLTGIQYIYNESTLNLENIFQSRRMELPASTIPSVLQRFRESMYLGQLSQIGGKFHFPLYS